MNKHNFEEQRDELFELSDRLFGTPEDLDLTEAEALLRASGIEPDAVVSRVQERMAANAKSYELAKRPIRILLERAVEDLQPATDLRGSEAALLAEAREVVRLLLEQVRRVPEMLTRGVTLTFAAAYRKKAELSERDKQLLDRVVHELRERARGSTNS